MFVLGVCIVISVGLNGGSVYGSGILNLTVLTVEGEGDGEGGEGDC